MALLLVSRALLWELIAAAATAAEECPVQLSA